jgi:hypothetical protein
MHLTYRDPLAHTDVVSPPSAGEAGAPESENWYLPDGLDMDRATEAAEVITEWLESGDGPPIELACRLYTVFFAKSSDSSNR